MDSQDLIANIFNAEAKKGRYELTVPEITEHELNKKEKPEIKLSNIFKFIGHLLSPRYIPGDAAVHANLRHMKKLHVVRERIVPIIASDGKTYEKRLYSLTGRRSPTLRAEQNSTELARI